MSEVDHLLDEREVAAQSLRWLYVQPLFCGESWPERDGRIEWLEQRIDEIGDELAQILERDYA